jgi:hypothetical protein
MEQDIITNAKRRGRRRMRGFIETPINSCEIEQSEYHGNALSNAFGRFLLGVNLSRGLVKSKPS